MDPRFKHTLSASFAEAENGILDFESFMDDEPMLAGILIAKEFRQVVLDPELKPAAEAKGLELCELSTLVGKLIETCQTESRYVFAFTTHEYTVVDKYTKLGEEFLYIYKDGHKIAKRWARAVLGLRGKQDWSLKGLGKLVGIERKSHLGDQQAAQRLRYVRKMLMQRGSFEALTRVAKTKWTNLLSYNRADCEDLRKIVLTAAKNLEEH